MSTVAAAPPQPMRDALVSEKLRPLPGIGIGPEGDRGRDGEDGRGSPPPPLAEPGAPALRRGDGSDGGFSAGYGAAGVGVGSEWGWDLNEDGVVVGLGIRVGMGMGLGTGWNGIGDGSSRGMGWGMGWGLGWG